MTFQMPVPAGQSLAWKVCAHRAHGGGSRSARQEPEHRCWWPPPAAGLSTSHEKGEAAALQGWGGHVSQHLGVPVASKTS